MDLFAEVIALTAALDAAAVEYAICGGVALAIHGAPRATKDIDLMAREADLPRLRDVLRACGFTLEAGRPQDIVNVQRLEESTRGEHET